MNYEADIHPYKKIRPSIDVYEMDHFKGSGEY